MRRVAGGLKRFGNWWRNAAHLSLIFGGVLIAVAWVAVTAQIAVKNEETRKEQLAEITNFTQLFGQDTLRTAKELDRILLFLRRSYERLGGKVDWATLIKDDFTVTSRTVQIAITDETGRMLTSTAMLHPKTVVDLSDRAHFKAHLNTNRDELFISQPVIGRASGQWSIQFTRRYSRPDGSFGGVIVISLNPEAIIGVYDDIKSLPNAAFALIGKDDIVRAGVGAYANMLGRGYREGTGHLSIPNRSSEVETWSEVVDGTTRLVASKSVGDMPLTVIGSIDDDAVSPSRRRETALYYLWTAIFSALVLAVSVWSALRDRHHVTRITNLAYTDTLTGLQNRLSFKKRLDQIFERQPAGRDFALHLIDLDRFKAVNDTFGHPVGDKLLAAVALRIRSATRATDGVYRLGGDEFALLQSECTSQEQAAQVASRICRVLDEPFRIDGQKLHIGSSIGIALTRLDASTTTGILQAADMALYLSKSEGRGIFRFFNAAMNVAYHRRRELELDLGMAVERNELILFYQPKMSSGGICGYEALIRWAHPTRGMLSPGEFIDLAEETGQIVEIGEWVLREACARLARQSREQTIAINVSPLQFSRSNVVDTVEQALLATGLPARRLEIEITESMLMRRDKSVLAQLTALRKLGVRIALDDFGTGYSSLSYLHTYPIDCIKIDRSFVNSIGKSDDAGPIIRAIITMASELHMTTVAEGVETQAHLDALLDMGCQVFQGYYFGKPRSAEETWPSSSTSHHQISAA